MPEPLVTVGLPVYNAETYVELALRSVLNQDYRNWELIVLDDGSTDRSLEIVRAVQDSRIRVLADGTNRGLSARLNETVQQARGEFYVRMDADDLMVPHRLSAQIEFLQKHPGCDVVGASAYIINGKGELTGIRSGNPFSESGFLSVLQGGAFIHPTVTGKTAWFRANPYDTTVERCEDIELWLRTADRSNFGQIEEPLLFYREEGNQAAKVEQTSRGYRQVLRRLLQTAPEQYRPVIRRQLQMAQVKIMARRVLHKLGGEQRIVQARSQPLTAEQRRTAEVLLRSAVRDPHPTSVN
ncbi:glycosyltransferase family A protein [Deinococcus sp. NW-56]|uniref:glycosyltransferase family 2 protein n=1 Tax=Deinococcus sp. NW-56 TaxID=2080419 RepID=UPI000CF4614C|nr:glycosyltransferase family A protein [Deinococcus sp. NW-56]